jgi:hypothetical protein
MLPHIHFIFSLFLGIILFYCIPEIGLFGFILIISTGVLIDIDHYIFYIYKKRDFNLIKAINWFLEQDRTLRKLPFEKRKEFFQGFFIFHGLEFLVIIYILGLYLHRLFFLILISSIFHLFLDYLYQIKIYGRKNKISIIYDFINFKKYSK